MNEEEKKAIEHLKNTSFDPLEYMQDVQSVDIVLNLIDKQQKEIEELKKENKQLKQCNKNLVAEIEYLEEK